MSQTNNKRYKLLRWLRNKASISPVQTPPKWLKFLYYLLFPLNWFYEKQAGIYYDFNTNVYWIMDMKFSGDVFAFMSDSANKGRTFRIVKQEKGLVTIEELQHGNK